MNIQDYASMAQAGLMPSPAASRLPLSATRQAAIEAGKEFESMFLAQMMAPLVEAMGEADELTSAGEGNEIYQSLLMNEYGKLISQSGGIGIAEHVTRQLLNQQEML